MSTYSAGEASLGIVPDATGFKQKLEADLKRIKAEFGVKITADTTRARADLDKFRTAEEVKAIKLNAQADTALARADIAKFRAEQEAAKALKINAQADLSRAKADLATFRLEQEQARAVKLKAEVDKDHLKKSFNEVKSDFEKLGSTLGKALKIDAAVVGVDLLPAAATGLASVAQALQQVAQAGLAVPGILAGVGASVGTLALGLGGVKDAWTAANTAATASGASQARLAEQATAATNALRNAKVDEATAQKDVAQAYRDARQQLEDLNIEQRGGVLSEKEAILEAAKARRDLATGRFKDGLDYESAQLRVEEADQRVVQARQRNIELQAKVGEANAKGVTGADQVVAANERLVRSHQAVAAAQASIADQGAGGAADKAAEAMAKLAPNARAFVQTMIDLKPAALDLRNTVQNNLFAGMSQSLKTLADKDLPNLKKGLGGIATSLNSDFKQLFASLGSDSSKGLLDRILGNTADADARVKNAIDPIVHAVGVLSAAGSDSLPRLADAIDHIAERFDHFISAAAQDGRLEKWISDGLTGVTHLGDIVLNLGKSFTAVTKAIGGEGLLASLDRVTGKMAEFLNSASGQDKLTRFFAEGREEFHKWEPIIENLAKTLPALFSAAKDTADEFRPIIKEITDTLAKNPQLVHDIAEGFLLWETAIKPVAAVVKAIEGLTKTYEALKLMINGTRDAALIANGAMAAGGVGAGGAGAAGGAGGALAGAGAGIGTGLGGAAATVLGPAVAFGVGAPLIQDQLDKGLTNNGVGVLPTGGNPYYRGKDLYTRAEDAADLSVPSGFPKPGSVQAEESMSGLAAKGDLAAQWVVSTPNKWEQAVRYAWLANHQDADNKPEFRPPPDYSPQRGAPPPGMVPGFMGGAGSFAAGGPTHESGGGRLAVVHPKEYVANATGRSTLGDAFLGSANRGVIDVRLLPHFDVGGPGDKNVDPTLGPAPVAPSPMGGGGMLNNVLGSIASGVSGPIGNAISFGSGLMSQAQAGGTSGGVMGGGGQIPGIWGMLQAGGNPAGMQAWGSQTMNWLGNFGAKTGMSAATIGLQGVLGAVGLGGSILSPSNVYNQAIQQTAGFYMGDQSPFAALGGGGAGGTPESGMQSITLGDGSVIQIPTYGTSGVASPAGMVAGGGADPAALRAIGYAQTHAVGQPYSYGGVGPNYDCSGIASAVYAAAKGLPQGQRYFTTESDFAALGFVPGYSKGDLNIGVMRGGGGPNSHMVLTLPNGINVESGGATNTTNYGGAAKGALDLPLRWHLPLAGNQAVGSVPGLYDDGGPLPVGVTLAMNNTGQQEQVYTAQQHAQAQQALQSVAQHAAQQPTPGPTAQHVQSPAGAAPQQAMPAVPVPSPAGTVAPPASQAAPAGMSPSLAAPAVAPAPSSLDHNLKAIDTGIDSAAATLGSWAAIAASMGMMGAGAGAGGGAAGSMISGLFKQGGEIAKNAVNVGSSFLVGNITPGTQDSAYGAQLRPAQNYPNVAPSRTQNNTFNGMDIPRVFAELDLRDAQEQQSALATHRR